MSTSLQIVFSPNVQGFNCVTSVQVADLFDLEHKNVLRKVAALIEEEELGELNFEPTSLSAKSALSGFAEPRFYSRLHKITD